MPALLLAAALAAAVPPSPPVQVAPTAVTLVGPRDSRQLLAAAGPADVTHSATVTADPPGIVAISDGLFLRPVKDGVTTLTISANGTSAKIPVTVKGFAAPAPVSFRRDVIATLNVGGCNAGACHGTPSGKNGFKLSLRGSDPAADYLQLSRDQFGRRGGSLDPLASLVLLKGLGRVPHEGGARVSLSGVPGTMLAGWLAGGQIDDPAALAPVAGIDVFPGSRVLSSPANRQQIAVVARFADGTSRDVTRITNFSTSDTDIADVSPEGLVEFKRAGEVAVLCRYLEELVAVRLTYLEPREGFAWPNPPAANFIDTHVYAKLKRMTIAPSGLSTDSEFVRRAFLDACGRVPTTAEAKAFLADPGADKRTTLIDTLLAKPEFADFWAMKWADVLRSSRKSLLPKGTFAFQQWLRDRFHRNVGFDTIVREMLTATGNTFTNPPANFYRVAKDPQSLAEATAQLFLGVRMQCAKCHNHPFERWTQDDYYGTAAWFARVKQKPDPEVKPGTPAGAEVVFASRDGDVSQPRTGKTMKPHFPGGADAEIKPGEDRRVVFADWLTKPGNPFFAKSVANRVWFHLTGRGIVDPVDDFRESNPASNDELLNALAADFAASGFDTKKLVRTVMMSRTYQLSAATNDTNRDDAKYFSHATTKLLTAEQLLDALCDATGVPEKFPGLPAGTRAVQLPDGEGNHPFLKAFGQPARELACECEREADGNLGQALQLVNGPTVNEKVRDPKNRLGPLLAAKTADVAIVENLYFAAVSRPPHPEETAAALAHVAKATDKRKGWEDVLWAVLNTREFLFRH